MVLIYLFEKYRSPDIRQAPDSIAGRQVMSNSTMSEFRPTTCNYDIGGSNIFLHIFENVKSFNN